MEEKKTSTFEKIAYAMGDSGSGSFVWLFTSSFLMLYYTDGVLAAAGTIGTMMLIMRVFDGFSDILFGVLLENTSTRIGKARPWFGASSIPLVISFILMFHVPSNIGKTAYYKRKKTLLHELAHIELNQLCQVDKDLFAFKVDKYEDEADKYIKFILESLKDENLLA